MASALWVSTAWLHLHRPGRGHQVSLSELHVGHAVQGAKRAEDRYFHHVLYGALVDWGAHQQLLDTFADSIFLESYLREEVGLPRTFAGTPLPPLSKREVTHLLLLARLYSNQKR